MLKNTSMRSAVVLVLSLLLILAPSLDAYSQSTGAGKVQDSELVINTINDQGEVSGIQVLNHLRAFGTGSALIEDGRAFKVSSIRNLYGKEKVQVADDKIKVNVNVPAGKDYQDVYYLATLDKSAVDKVKMPVSVKVKYFLDEKEMPASAIAGKSGHLRIICELENLTGAPKTLEFKNKDGETVTEEATVYTPYVVSLSGWKFDNKKFSNIKAPGVAEKSPEGVAIDVQGITTVSWKIPLVPPKYPAKQYITLEADGQNISLDSFKIAVIPIVPTTSEFDSLGTVQDSYGQLYDAFDSIDERVGEPGKGATLLFELTSVKNVVKQISERIGTLTDKMKQVRFGLSNPLFDLSSYDSAKGTDGKGNKPGVREAVAISKTAMDSQLLPAFEGQKQVLTGLETFIGKPGAEPVEPSASTSVYNDMNYLKGLLAGTPAEAVISQSINTKLFAIGTNVTVLRDGGTLIMPDGTTMEFPASVNTVAAGAQQLSAGLDKAGSGLGMIVLNMGNVDANGNPTTLMIDGKPGSLLYTLSYIDKSINGKIVPGVDQIIDGTGKIGEGSVTSKEAITAGLITLQSAPAIVFAMESNVAQANTFMGKPEGAEATVSYIFQTPKVDNTAKTMNYGLGAIVLVFIILFALGRPPKQIAQVPGPDVQV